MQALTAGFDDDPEATYDATRDRLLAFMSSTAM